jgi:omega-amidase
MVPSLGGRGQQNRAKRHPFFMRITIVQQEIRWEDKTANLTHLTQIISGLSGKTDLIILPETFNTGFTMNASEMAEETGSVTFKWMQETAVKVNSALCGSYFVKDSGRFYNRFLFVDSSGKMASYDKRHLFSIGGENVLFTSGSQRAVFKYMEMRVNPVVCYDLRFPVWLRNRGDYDILICVANWPESRREVWNTLLSARAIENQCYLAGVNCIGIDNAGNRCVGESVIIDPKGRIIAALPQNKEGTATAEISLKELNDFRSKFPVWKDADDFTII